ncbi:MAG: DUF72 domain-containing protein [Spirochaetes bacterium]|nr:DUF72 domain-containing protein [Spirochaetota bacterium]
MADDAAAGTRILVGTSGYSYDDWRGVLYPEGLGKDEFLKYYSLRFPFVELNFSYYAMPTARSLASMAARTPSGFLCSIKAHRSLTHEPTADWRKDAAAFADAAAALAAAGKLAGILVQLPYRFHRTPENRAYLGSLCDELTDFPLFVEFRNDDWFGGKTLEELDERGIGLVLVDAPDLKGLPPDIDAVTGKRAYVRFHGRNAEAWWSGDNVTRYDYLYSEDELAGWVPKIRRIAKKAELVLVAFNNHARGRAVTNADRMTQLLL